MKVRGFTLIEMVITVAIVGLLATAAMPLLELTVKRGKEAELRVNLREIRGALDAYKRAADQGRIEQEADASGYPPTLATLVEGVEDSGSPDHKRIYFMRRIPRDPFFPDSEVPAHKTWGLRSYESPPDEPKGGKDVFDVYSQSEKKGLNGVAYKKW